MSEVKSTLDLVMERTKHLTMSRAEKQDQAVEEAKKQFNGVVVKYLDGLMDLQEVNQAVSKLKETYPALDNQSLSRMVLDRMDLEDLEGPLPGLLHGIFGCSVEGLKQLAREYAQAVQAQAAGHADRVRKILQQEHQISGTAVVPNLDADPQWHQEKNSIVSAYENKLAVEKNRL